MNSLFQRYATPLITGLFLVSLVSGVALFFHVGQSAFHGMHEWLSMALIAPFVLHLWRNWRAMTTYFNKPAFAGALAVSLVAALAFVAVSFGAAGRGGPPQFALLRTLYAATPAELAPALKTDAERIVAALKDRGFAGAAANLSLSAIATGAGKDEASVAAALATLTPR